MTAEPQPGDVRDLNGVTCICVDLGHGPQWIDKDEWDQRGWALDTINRAIGRALDEALGDLDNWQPTGIIQ